MKKAGEAIHYAWVAWVARSGPQKTDQRQFLRRATALLRLTPQGRSLELLDVGYINGSAHVMRRTYPNGPSVVRLKMHIIETHACYVASSQVPSRLQLACV